MNIGQIPIPSGWKLLAVKAVLVLVVLAGCWFGWRNYQESQVPEVTQEQVLAIQTQIADLQAGFVEIQAIPEQVRKEVRQGVKAVVLRVDSYDTGARIAELERIISIGRAIRAEGLNDNSD